MFLNGSMRYWFDRIKPAFHLIFHRKCNPLWGWYFRFNYSKYPLWIATRFEDFHLPKLLHNNIQQTHSTHSRNGPCECHFPAGLARKIDTRRRTWQILVPPSCCVEQECLKFLNYLLLPFLVRLCRAETELRHFRHSSVKFFAHTSDEND